MSEKITRRDFLKAALVAAGVVLTADLPKWVDIKDDNEFNELVKICTEVLNEDEVADLMDVDDFQDALGLVFSFLVDKEIDPEEYLIMQNFLR